MISSFSHGDLRLFASWMLECFLEPCRISVDRENSGEFLLQREKKNYYLENIFLMIFLTVGPTRRDKKILTEAVPWGPISTTVRHAVKINRAIILQGTFNVLYVLSVFRDV